MIPGELPLKGSSQPLVMTFEPAQAQGQSRQRRKVIGSEDLTLDDGEVKFDLIEPAGVDGAVNQA